MTATWHPPRLDEEKTEKTCLVLRRIVLDLQDLRYYLDMHDQGVANDPARNAAGYINCAAGDLGSALKALDCAPPVVSWQRRFEEDGA